MTPSIVPTKVPSPQPTSRPSSQPKQIINFSADTPTIVQLSITESFCATLYLAFISAYYDSLYTASIPTHSTSINASNRSTHPICLQSIPVNNLHISRPVHHLNNHVLGHPCHLVLHHLVNHLVGHLDSQQVYQQSIYLVYRHINLRLPLRISLLFSLFHRRLFTLDETYRPAIHATDKRHRIPPSVYQGIPLRNQALPSKNPSKQPTAVPSSIQPTNKSSIQPTHRSSIQPVAAPSRQPSSHAIEATNFTTFNASI